jgi:hypothetical protein
VCSFLNWVLIRFSRSTAQNCKRPAKSTVTQIGEKSITYASADIKTCAHGFTYRRHGVLHVYDLSFIVKRYEPAATGVIGGIVPECDQSSTVIDSLLSRRGDGSRLVKAPASYGRAGIAIMDAAATRETLGDRFTSAVFRYVYGAPLLAGNRIPVLTPTQPIGA